MKHIIDTRESTVDMLTGENDAYVALYILDSAASHISQDETAFNTIDNLRASMAREYDSANSESALEIAAHNLRIAEPVDVITSAMHYVAIASDNTSDANHGYAYRDAHSILEDTQALFSTPAHTWCIGEREIAACPICHAHIMAFLEASAAKRPLSNILRGDIRTFNEENLPAPAKVEYAKCIGCNHLTENANHICASCTRKRDENHFCKTHKGEHGYVKHICGHEFCPQYWTSCPRCYGSTERNMVALPPVEMSAPVLLGMARSCELHADGFHRANVGEGCACGKLMRNPA
jgi:hypothetical protein